MIATLTSLKLEPKLLSSRIMQLYKAFHLMQNLGCKPKNVRGRGLKTLWKWATKNGFFLYFQYLSRRLKNCKTYHVLLWYASLVKILLKFELIKALCSSFIRLIHLSSFRPMLSSYRIILNILRVFWVRLGSFRSILGHLGSFRLIWAHLDSLELINTHLSSFRLTQPFLYLFRLIYACSGSVRTIIVIRNGKIVWKHSPYLAECWY